MFVSARQCVSRRYASTSSWIDTHSHMYPSSYMNILRKRKIAPRVVKVGKHERLIILPGEDKEVTTASGRPIGSEYWNIADKLKFMQSHNISSSIVSPANPWLEFLTEDEATDAARDVNDELSSLCSLHQGKIYGLATLPLQSPEKSARELERVMRNSKNMKGAIISTAGQGKGLDDDGMKPLFAAAEELNAVLFLHPHRGVGNENFGGFGHVLFLALGFPFDTTVAASRFVLSGGMERHPTLKLLLAHSGGTLPFLAGRLDSCVDHDIALSKKLNKPPSEYLKQFYYDAVNYSPQAMDCVLKFVGHERLVFGTDHPFFPPLEECNTGKSVSDCVWPSTLSVQAVVNGLKPTQSKAIMAGNAKKLFNL